MDATICTYSRPWWFRALPDRWSPTNSLRRRLGMKLQNQHGQIEVAVADHTGDVVNNLGEIQSMTANGGVTNRP
jgi:hypothetical protein